MNLWTVKIAISLLVPLALGYFWLGLFRPVGRWGIRLSLSVGIGFGLSSLLFFVWLLAVGRATASFMLFQSLAVLVLILASWWLHRRGPIDSAPSAEPLSPFQKKLGWAFAIILFVSLIFSFLQILYLPHGHWDAWDLWNMRALFLVKAGSRWPEFFVPEMPRNMDYPLMLSGAIAAAWKFIGSTPTWIPSMIALFFTLATTGLLTSALQSIRSPSQGWIAGILLASTPFFAEHGVSQYADVELAFYILGSVALWTWSDREASPSHSKIALSGMLAGMAAWTKNEGQLLILVLLTARILCRARRDPLRKIAGELAIWLLGTAPFLLAVAYFKATIAPPNDLFNRRWELWVERLSNPERYRVIAKTWAETLPRFGRWRFGIPVALLIYAAAVGRSSVTRPFRRFPLLTLVLMALGYFFTYVLTPYDVPWHLRTSLERLYFQLWPLGLFTLALWLRAPEEFAKAE